MAESRVVVLIEIVKYINEKIFSSKLNKNFLNYYLFSNNFKIKYLLII